MTASYDFSNWVEAPDELEDLTLEAALPAKPIEPPIQAPVYKGPSAYAEQILLFGESQGWEDFGFLGNAPFPSEIVRLERWKLVPYHLDHGDIHAKARKRVKRLVEARFVFRGLVIAHELPKPVEEETALKASSTRYNTSLARDFGRSAVEVGERVIPAALGTMAVLGGVLLALAATTMTAAAAGLAAVDPVVIGVTRDNSWIEIFRWQE